MTVESRFLFDQTIRVIVDAILFTTFVLDVGEQETVVIIPVAQFAAVRVNASGQQVEVVAVFVAGFPALLVNKTRYFVVVVVVVLSAPVARENFVRHPPQAIVLITGNGATGVFLGQ